MERVKFTTERITAIKPPSVGEVVIGDSDVPWLLLRVRAGGSKTWMVRYRPPGGRAVQVRRVTIGNADKIGIGDARRSAQAIAGGVATGGDPQQERRVQRRQEEARLDRAVEGYVKSLHARQVVKAKDIETLLTRELVGRLGKAVDLTKLNRRDFVKVFDAVQKSGRPGTATDLRTRASVFLNWATAEGLLQHNVLAGLKRPRVTRAQSQERKGRALTAEEIGMLWRAAEAGGDPYFTAYVRVVLLTGCRRNEAAAALRSWIKVVEGLNFMVLPREVTKAGREHAVPLPPSLLAMLTALPKGNIAPDLVFVGRHGKPMSGWTQRWAKVRSALAEAGFRGDLTLHDLRRTARSWWTSLGAEERLAEMMLNHRPKNTLVNLYDRAEMLPERTALAVRWAAEVERMVGVSRAATGAEVVPLRVGRRTP